MLKQRINDTLWVSTYMALYDWLTITTFDLHIVLELEKRFDEITRNERVTERVERRLQYESITRMCDGGSFFVGHGEQQGLSHWMIQISGELAHAFRPTLARIREPWRFSIKRVDLQITIDMPDEWSQFRLLTALKERGYKIGWEESRGKTGALETVYIGSRRSERYTRIYVKETANHGRLIRFEVEYKRRMAENVINQDSDGTPLKNMLRHEVSRKPDEELHLLFLPHLGKETSKVTGSKREMNTNKTQQWLLSQVLSCLGRYLEETGDVEVASEFIRVCSINRDSFDNGA